MSIANCKHCKLPYWRYRSDHPPSGYCSSPHAELGPAKKEKKPLPPKPDAILFELRAHRITEHRDRFFLQWYDCQECTRLEEIYSASLNYWFDHPVITGAIAVESAV